MASLIVAVGIFTHNKIRDKREARKEKKRLAYQARYDELEAEHKAQTEKSIQRQMTNDSQFSSPRPTSQEGYEQIRRSSDSQRSREDDSEDNPSRWVDEVVKQRTGGGSST